MIAFDTRRFKTFTRVCATLALLALPAACAPARAPSPGSSALAVALPTPLVLRSEAPPQILAVRLSDPVLHTGETVSGTVITSTNVASVRVEFAGRAGAVPQRQPGVFALSYTIPHIPFFLYGSYTAQVVAQNSAGLTAERDVTVSIR